MDDVTARIVAETKSGWSDLRHCRAAKNVTATDKALLARIDGIALGFTSNALTYDPATRGLGKRAQRRLVELLFAGHVRVFQDGMRGYVLRAA